MSTPLNNPIDLREASRLLSEHLRVASRPLIVLVGPTASGKTALSLTLAERISGLGESAEIINADSRQLYRHLDIGTAKIRPEEMRGVPHHLIDVLDPREEITIARYQTEAIRIIEEIQGRGAVPILVGGSMLYISSVIDGLKPLPFDSGLRAQLEKEYDEFGGVRLHRKLSDVDPDSALGIDPNNRPYVVRALEIALLTGDRPSELKSMEVSPYDIFIFGISWQREALVERINARTKQMLDSGWIEEVQGLLAKGYRSSDPAMKSHGYREICAALQSGSVDRDELAETIAAKTRQYAKRQTTWWKYDERIVWMKGNDVACRP